MKTTYYRQCKLQKKISDGIKETTSYIPEPYCVQGKVLKLRDDNGVWEDGWKVIFASEHRHTEEETNKNAHQWTKHRQATDI
jgi:hypothetical protein